MKRTDSSSAAAPRGLRRLALSALLAAAVSGAVAQEAQIRKNLAERLPNLPKIDEVSRTPVPGLWEVRIGTDVMYTDDKGDHLIQGAETVGQLTIDAALAGMGVEAAER